MKMEKGRKLLKKIIKKENYIKSKIVVSVIISMILAFILEKKVMERYFYQYFSIDRLIILMGTICLAMLCVLLEIRSKLNALYQYRFYLAGGILLIVVLLGYSGSSINILDQAIQYTKTDASYEEILGKSRLIRSDEWAINTPLAFSQSVGEEGRYGYFSNKLRGTSTDMFTVINAPVLDIVSIGKIFNLGYLFGNKTGLSFWWYGRLIALMLVTFELSMILTKKNKKISVIGMLMITFSPAVQWWYSNFIADILIWGGLAIILIDKFMLVKKTSQKIVCLIGIAISAISYVFTFYPAWIISFGYVYLALFIWILVKNRKEYRINGKDGIGIAVALLFVIIIGIRYYSMSSETLRINIHTDYPGERFILGGEPYAKSTIFSYIYSILLPFKGTNNPCEQSSMLSFFPIPVIMALVFLFKQKEDKKKYLSFFLPMFIVVGLLSIWTFVETNKIFAKLTFLYMVPCNRGVIPLGFSQILLLLYVVGHLKPDESIFSRKHAFIGALICVTAIFLYVYHVDPDLFLKGYVTPKCMIMLIPLNILVFYLILSYNEDKREKKWFYLLSVLLILANGLFVNPIIKGVQVVYNKPVAKEIQKIVGQDKEAIWITESTGFIYSNYLVANGAKVINSTNYYPNFKLYQTILGEEKANKAEIKSIYNRYAHTNFELVEGESDVKLVNLDVVQVDINVEDIKQMNVKYLLSIHDLESYNSEEITFESIYDQDGIYIYEVSY